MFIFSIIGAYSIAIAAFIGLIRFNKIHKTYQPFVIICTAGLCNEIISLVTARLVGTNNINYNIYGIIEAMLYIWLFRGWGHFSNKKRSYLFVLCFLWVIWITDNFILGNFKETDFLFMVVYSFTLVFLSINEINLIVMNSRGTLLKNARFLICMGILIFYTYTATISIFYLFDLHFSVIFYARVYMLLQAVNFLINLVFALAMLWAPGKQRFILPF